MDTKRARRSDLVLDIGNTRVKWALYEDHGLVTHGLKDLALANALLDELPMDDVRHVVVGSTAHPDPDLVERCRSYAPVLEITGGSEAPVRSRYGTLSTLGADRLANVVAAFRRFPGRATLAIDLGTCVTYDLCSAEGEHLGGAISPGLLMRARAMHAYSARLPLITPAEAPEVLGRTTQQCLEAGVHHGLLGEVEGFIRRYRTELPDLVVLLTGGDALRVVRGNESGIFALPLLTLDGYHELLAYHRSHHPAV